MNKETRWSLDTGPRVVSSCATLGKSKLSRLAGIGESVVIEHDWKAPVVFLIDCRAANEAQTLRTSRDLNH